MHSTAHSGFARRSTAMRAGAALLAVVATLSACGSSGGSASSSASQSASTESTITLADTWVRSSEGTSDPTMTAAFGIVTNSGPTDRTIVSATNDISARTELHEMAMTNGVMIMRPVEGGITVPANSSVTLEPGGLHIMLMDLRTMIAPGDDVHVTLTMDDGSSVLFHALAKQFAGGNEQYNGGATSTPSGSAHG